MFENNKNNLNFQEFFVDLLFLLNPREQEVLKKRYQLTSDLERKHTLKQIGDEYGITRERVRQIEKEAIMKLVENSKKQVFGEKISVLQGDLVVYMERKGGLVTQDSLIKEHALAKYDFDFLHLNSFLFLLDQVIPIIKKNEENEDYYSFWQLSDVQIENIATFLKKVSDFFQENNKTVLEDELFEMLEKQFLNDKEKQYLDKFIEKHNDLTYRELLSSFLKVTKKVEKNILNHWGLAGWSNIRPKKLSDKIQLVFAKNSEPLHFREVAENINNFAFDKKKICAATVHNELIANSMYVLIGRGIYAMKEWGFSPGTVTDIIVSILKETQSAMSKDEIYKEVLKQRKVNSSTIYLSLINKKIFEKLNNGKFIVK